MKILTIFLLCLMACDLTRACSVNCDVCSGNDQCTSCIDGYQLLVDYSCKKMNLLQGCQLYALTGRCAQCIDGFNLIAGLCYPPIANCQQYGPGNTCAQCKSNFSSYEDNCFQSNNTVCGTPGTALYRGMCISVPLSNCQEMIEGVCVTCLQGYKLLNGLCYKLGQVKQPACQSPNLDGSCNRCVASYYLEGGVCLNATSNNCAKNFGLYCIECQQGYANNNGACFRLPRPEDANCNVADVVTLECFGCNPQYRLNSTNWCVRQNTYCQTYDSNAKCLSCLGQLVLRSGICVYSDANCILSDYDTGICLRCKPGFSLSSDQSTCNTLETCSTRDESGKCTLCIDSHQLIEGSCSPLGANCLKLDPIAKTCVSCLSGTSLINEQCVFATSNCLSYDLTSGICLECEAGYYRSQRSCLAYPAGCTRVDRKNKCSNCGNGLVLADGNCVAQVESCLYYSATGCQFCRPGSFLSSGKCQPLPKFCGFVDQEGKCLYCQSPSVIYRGRCVFFQVFCLDYDSNGNCSSVPRDFSLGRNSTVTNRFAGQWDALGNMVLCQGGYTLVNNNCVLNIDNCTSYDQMGACSTCAEGFALKETICINQTALCLVKQNGKCSLCTPEFAVVNGTCYSRKNFGVTFDAVGYPITYQTGYLFTVDYNVSLALGYNCLKQNFSTGKCLECAKHYTLEGNSCVVKDANCASYNQRGICQSCNKGFRYVFGVCRSVQFCSAMTPNNTCSSCYQGFMLTSGVCVRQAINYCGAYDGSSVCTACYPNYFVTPINTCATKPKNCLVLAPQSGSCVTCRDGFRLTTNQCERLVQNCQSYVTTGCSACQMGFSLVGGECMQLPLMCRSLNATTLKCSECAPGFVLVNNKEFCANNVSRCSTYNFDGSCRVCVQGFYLINNRCLNVTTQCVRYNENNTCIECASPYTFSGGECRILTNGCLQYANATCSRCETGSFLSKQQCVKNPANCLNFSAVSNACVNCIPGFTAKGGVCTTNNVNMDGCAQQLSPVECKECLPGFSLGRDGLCLATICIRFDTGMRCLECPPRFQLSNGQCSSKNCMSLDPSTGQCTLCTAGYELIRNGSKVVYCRAKNCQSFGEADQCTGCIANYSLNNNRLCSIANCFTEVNFVCFACNDGFVLRSGFCQIDNCAQLSASGVCVACNPNYLLRDGMCIRDPRCNIFLPNGGPCQQCNSGYTLSSSGLCQLANCDQPTPDGNCVKCLIGFSLTSSGQCLSSFCLTYDTSNICTKCTAGYSVVNGTCWITGCSNLTLDGSCGVCLPRYDNYNGLCRPANCTVVSDTNSTTCKECNALYSLTDGLCFARGCATYDQKKDCAVCNPGLRPLGGFCSFLNCRRFNSNRCLQCAPGFSFDGDRLCTSRSCQTYNVTTGGCLGCFSGMVLRGDLCVDTYCSATAANGSCSSCVSGFMLDSASHCWLPEPCRALNSEGRCVSCIAGYQIDASTGSCQLSNCLYLDNLNNCIQCATGFTLKDRICLAGYCDQFDSMNSCFQCQSGYTLLADGSCQVTNCQQMYASKCIKCLPGYSLQSGICKVDSCAEYGPNGVCAQCFGGYTMRNSRCLSDFCLTFDNSGVACTQCRGGYLIERGQCVKISRSIQVVGCVSYNVATGRCAACGSGFSLNGEICQSRYCAHADQQQCQECLPGYSLVDGNSRCVASNCASYQNMSYECLGCVQNYLLEGGQCVYQEPVNCPAGQFAKNRVCSNISIRFCEAMDPVGAACARCSSFATLVSGRCFNLNNCDQYDENGCQACSASYYLSNSFCVASQVTFCNISDSTGRCLKCLSGYILINEKCYDVSQNCLQFDEAGCSLCQNGYAIQEGICAQLSPNCAALYSNGSCQRCVMGYQLSGNNSCIRTVANCKKYNFTGCNLCEKYYTLSQGGACTKMIEGCASMTQDGVCRACSPAYTMQQNNSTTPPTNVCLRSVDNCLAYGQDGCLFCKVGFKIVSGACASIVSYCTQYDPDNQCTFCQMGYYLSSGLCIPLPNNCLGVDPGYMCTACQTGFVLLRGACFPENLLCLEYDQNSGQCLRCNEKGYMDSNSTCVQLPSKCQEADPATGSCLTCAAGFEVSNGGCFKRVTGCRQYSSSGCSQCLQGYNKTPSGECRPDKSSCESFDSKGKMCVLCASGYAISAGVCYRQIANCAAYASNSSCAQCSAGFLMSAGVCVSESCQIVDNGTCKRCSNGYTLQNGQCQPLCLRTNNSGVCVECVEGYSLVDAVACIKTISYCRNYGTNGQCLACEPSYYLNGKLGCSALPPFCSTSDPNGVCIKCFGGYTLTNGFCLGAQLPPNCQSVDAGGKCKSCQAQFSLVNGSCVKVPIGCMFADGSGCRQCRVGLLLLNGICVPPSLRADPTRASSSSSAFPSRVVELSPANPLPVSLRSAV